MPDPTTQAIVNEIKVILQEELTDVRQTMHKMDLKLTELQGQAVARKEFQKALDEERLRRTQAEERAREAHKDNADKIQALQTEQTAMKTSMKIYIGIASAIAGIAGSGIGAAVFAALG